MDSVTFQALVIELNNVLANSRIDKISQLGPGTILLKGWSPKGKHQFLLKADGQGACFLTSESHVSLERPARFCQLLRARLKRIVSIQQEPFCRVVKMKCQGIAGLTYSLILEAGIGQGNLILLDDTGKIIDSLWRKHLNREYLPGIIYHPPVHKEQISLFGERAEVVLALGHAVKAVKLSDCSITPLSQALLKGVCSELETGQSLDSIVAKIQKAFFLGHFDALQVSWNNKMGYLPLLFNGNGIKTVRRFENLSEMVEASILRKNIENFVDIKEKFYTQITKHRKKLQRRLEKIIGERRSFSDSKKLEQMGHLLLANFHLIDPGKTHVMLENLYETIPGKIQINLNPKLGLQQNADRYFKRARKIRHSIEHNYRRERETLSEMEWLAHAELALEEARTGDEVYQVQLDLEAAGLLKKFKGRVAKRKLPTPKESLKKATTPSGYQVFWGSNNRDNDYLSRRLLKPNDLWFHVKGLPGAHVVLKINGDMKDVKEEDTLFAAAIAAGYSKARNATKVEVIVSLGQDVSHPKGYRPGLVQIGSYRSVNVKPMRFD